MKQYVQKIACEVDEVESILVEDVKGLESGMKHSNSTTPLYVD